MNLDSVIRLGCRPWLPNPDATDLEVWHRDDVPVVGLFSMHDDRILFMAVGDIECPLTVWAYLPVPPEKQEALESAEFESLQDLYDVVENQFAKAHFDLATAWQFELDKWCQVEVPEEDVYVAALAFLTKLAELHSEPAPGPTVEEHLEAFLDVREAAASATY